MYLFRNNNRNQSAYNYWNFTTSGPWDNPNNNPNMWYSNDTTYLAGSVNYIIGRDSIEKINLEVTPLKYIYIQKNVSSSLLGVPFKWNDVIERKLLIH